MVVSTFERYLTQEDGERHMNPHWRSISYMCQPCRVAYQYVMDIETSQEDSDYVFRQLNFNTSLPGLINTRKNDEKTKKNPRKQLEDYYKNIPKALIKKVYAKYYLDFVLLGFSSGRFPNWYQQDGALSQSQDGLELSVLKPNSAMVSQVVNSGTDVPSNYTKRSKYIFDDSIRFRNICQFLWAKSKSMLVTLYVGDKLQM